MMTDEEIPEVVVHSELEDVGEPEHFHIHFTLDSAVSGVTASGHLITFQRGNYRLKIHLPAGFHGNPTITWSSGTPPAPQGVSSNHGETWVEFGLQNTLASGTENFPFLMNADFQDQPGGEPTVVSDPPPTVVFQSS